MAVLSDQDIEAFCQAASPLIEPYDASRLKSASYDLIVGREYYIHRAAHDNEVSRSPIIDKLKKKAPLSIPPNAVCFVITEETVQMAPDLAASLSLPLGLLKKGIILAKQPPLDPGYRGKLVAMLYNLSTEAVVLYQGQHVLSIEFQTLTRKPRDLYDGAYMDLVSLEDYIDHPLSSSLVALRDNVKNWRNQLLTFVPMILTAVSISTVLLLGIVGLGWFGQPDDRLPSEALESLEERVESLEERVTIESTEPTLGDTPESTEQRVEPVERSPAREDREQTITAPAQQNGER